MRERTLDEVMIGVVADLASIRLARLPSRGMDSGVEP